MISVSEDQSIIVFDLIRNKAAQKSEILNLKLLLHSDYIIKSDLNFQSSCKIYHKSDLRDDGQKSYDSENTLSEIIAPEKIQIMWSDIKHKQQYHKMEIFTLTTKIKNCNYLTGFVQSKKFINLIKRNSQNNFQDFNFYQHRQKVVFTNLQFDQTNSSVFIVVVRYKNEQQIVLFDLCTNRQTALSKHEYCGVINVKLNDNLLLIQEYPFYLLLFQNTSELFKSFEIIGKYSHDADIISIVLNSNFICLIDQNGIIVILNTKKLEKIKRINKELSFDQDNSISTSILYEQFYAIGLINGKLLIWNVQQEIQNNQVFFQFQLPKKQPIIQIQFSKNNCVVGCLCDNFIWFINFQSSQNQILRSAYYCFYNFIFYQNTPFILHFKKKQQLALSHLYDCINYEQLQLDDEIGFRKFSRDENYLAYHNNAQKLKINDFKGKCVIKIFNLKKSQISDVEFSIKNKRLVIFLKQQDQQLLDLWTIENQNNFSPIKIPAEINNNISTFEISNDEDYLMLATKDSKLYYIIIEKMEILFTFDDLENFVTAISFSPNQREFVLGFKDGSLVLYNLNKQQLLSVSNYGEREYTFRPTCTNIFSRSLINVVWLQIE